MTAGPSRPHEPRVVGGRGSGVGSEYRAVTASVAAMARQQSFDIVAEMVANVLAVGVEPGAVVAPGDEVALLESMKMEIPVIAEAGGTVVAVKVTAGDVVQEGDVLLTLT